MEPTNEDRIEPEVEIGHEPREYVSPSGFQRPRPPQPGSFKKWGIGLIILAVIGLLFLGTWIAVPPGLFFNKPPTESPEQRALKVELGKLRAETDLLKRDMGSLKEGQKNAQDQLGNLQDQVKALKEKQALLEKKAENPIGKKPVSQIVVYRVKKGDTLRSIAQKFEVRPEDIRRWNHLQANSQPKPGQKITVYSSSVP